MAVVLDAGALIAWERHDPTVIAVLQHAVRHEIPVVTTAGVTAQAWRDVPKQVGLTRLLRGVDERAIDPAMSQRIGVLLAAADATDVVDASVVDVARDGDEVLTSDPADIASLAEAAGLRIAVIPV